MEEDEDDSDYPEELEDDDEDASYSTESGFSSTPGTRSPSWPRWSPAPHAECSARLSLGLQTESCSPSARCCPGWIAVAWSGLAAASAPQPPALAYQGAGIAAPARPPPHLGGGERLCPAAPSGK
ncbi:uncharacterized protein [Symphalangus syndactylus]|uniref:uncharacterized protein isoform X2 n=1 Tax=Symphalangus syndactylus TaxID=9590 RepID=UPI00300609D4